MSGIKGVDFKKLIKQADDKRLLEIITLGVIADCNEHEVTDEIIQRRLLITLDYLVGEKVLSKQRINKMLKGL